MFSITISVIVYLLRMPLLSLYIDNQQAVEIACQRLTIIAATYFIFGIMDVLSQSVRGMGSSLIPMIIILFGTCFFRIFWIYVIFPINRVYTNVVLSYPVSWVLTLVIIVVAFFAVYNRCKKQMGNRVVVEEGKSV